MHSGHIKAVMGNKQWMHRALVYIGRHLSQNNVHSTNHDCVRFIANLPKSRHQLHNQLVVRYRKHILCIISSYLHGEEYYRHSNSSSYKHVRLFNDVRDASASDTMGQSEFGDFKLVHCWFSTRPRWLQRPFTCNLRVQSSNYSGNYSGDQTASLHRSENVFNHARNLQNQRSYRQLNLVSDKHMWLHSDIHPAHKSINFLDHPERSNRTILHGRCFISLNIVHGNFSGQSCDHSPYCTASSVNNYFAILRKYNSFCWSFCYLQDKRFSCYLNTSSDQHMWLRSFLPYDNIEYCVGEFE